MQSLVGIGTFEQALFLDDHGDLRMVRPKNLWLAWKGDPETGTLTSVLVDGLTNINQLNEKTMALHRQFHGSDVTAALQGRSAGAPVRKLGLLHSIRYDVPRHVKSNKAGKLYEHKSGDFGHGNGENRHDDLSLWPFLALDANDFPVIIRRKSNKFKLEDWLIG